jgi:hypothetical protein
MDVSRQLKGKGICYVEISVFEDLHGFDCVVEIVEAEDDVKPCQNLVLELLRDLDLEFLRVRK